MLTYGGTQLCVSNSAVSSRRRRTRRRSNTRFNKGFLFFLLASYGGLVRDDLLLNRIDRSRAPAATRGPPRRRSS
jgi:hypothetical protein